MRSFYLGGTINGLTLDERRDDMEAFDMLGPKARAALQQSPKDTMAAEMVRRFAGGLGRDKRASYLQKPHVDDMVEAEIKKRISAAFQKPADEFIVRDRRHGARRQGQ